MSETKKPSFYGLKIEEREAHGVKFECYEKKNSGRYTQDGYNVVIGDAATAFNLVYTPFEIDVKDKRVKAILTMIKNCELFEGDIFVYGDGVSFDVFSIPEYKQNPEEYGDGMSFCDSVGECTGDYVHLTVSRRMVRMLLNANCKIQLYSNEKDKTVAFRLPDFEGSTVWYTNTIKASFSRELSEPAEHTAEEEKAAASPVSDEKTAAYVDPFESFVYMGKFDAVERAEEKPAEPVAKETAEAVDVEPREPEPPRYVDPYAGVVYNSVDDYREAVERVTGDKWARDHVVFCRCA